MSPQSGVEPVLAAIVVGYALATAIPAGLAWYATRTRPDSATARAFAATMAGITVWSGAYFVRLFAPEWAIFGLTVIAFVGITTTPVAVLLFALQYTDREQYVTPGTTALLLVVPLVTLVLLATTRSHGLFYTSFRVVQVGPLRRPAQPVDRGSGSTRRTASAPSPPRRRCWSRSVRDSGASTAGRPSSSFSPSWWPGRPTWPIWPDTPRFRYWT